MPSKPAFVQWSILAARLADLTPVEARDRVIESFYEAQLEVFAREGGVADDPRIRQMVGAAVAMAFERLGADFEDPTVTSLHEVLDALVCQARSWGTPEDIVANHQAQALVLLQRLK